MFSLDLRRGSEGVAIFPHNKTNKGKSENCPPDHFLSRPSPLTNFFLSHPLPALTIAAPCFKVLFTTHIIFGVFLVPHYGEYAIMNKVRQGENSSKSWEACLEH